MIQDSRRPCKGRNIQQNLNKQAKNAHQTGSKPHRKDLQTAKEWPQNGNKRATKQGQNRKSLLSVALKLRKQGLSVVPVNASKGAAIDTWSPYQNRLMTDDELRRYFTGGTHGIALICGQVSSGGLEVLDFDNKVPDKVTCVYNAFSDIVRRERPELFDRLVINTTQNGGYHILYICTETPIPGSDGTMARAEYQADGKTKTTVLIETKGKGGYAVAPPTRGYVSIQGNILNIPPISADDRSYLIATARQFNQVEQKLQVETKRAPKVRQDGEQKAGDLYNQTDGYRELLTRHKWTLEKAFSTQERWLRPGSDSDSSATFFTDSRQFYVHSTNAGPLEADSSYDPFGLLVRLDFNSDHTEATRQLYAEHPEWSIPSNGYKPSRQEQLADDHQLERLAGLQGETPEGLEIPADSRDVGRGEPQLVEETGEPEQVDQPTTSLDEAGKTAQMRQAMQDTDRSIVELMKWTPGTGKTYEAETVAVEMAERGQNTIFAMLTHERAEQEAEAMLNRFGYRAAVGKGRNADNCSNYESAEALGRGGHSVRNLLCQKNCLGRQECTESGYLSQFDDYQKGKTNIASMPVEMAVELLKDNKGSATLNADVLVFDEDPSRIAMQTHTLTIKQLDQINPSNDQVGAVIDLLSELVLSVRNDGQVINDWSPLKGRIQSILKRFKRKGVQHTELAMDTERVLREVIGQINDTSRNLKDTRPESVARTEPRWLAEIASELNRTISADEPINASLVVTKKRLIFRSRRTINPKAKTIILDAYGRPEQYQQIFNKEVRVHQNQVKPEWKVWHVPMNTSRTRLKDNRPGRWTTKQDDGRPTKWQQVIKNLTSLFEYEQMVIFVDGKEMVAKAEAGVEALGLSDKVTVDYFYRGRGTNKYQDFDAVVILGQAEPRSDVIVSECRALHRNDEYIGGEVKNSNRRQFRDSRLQQFKESKQIDEIVQCVYRIRPATHPHQLGNKVLICTRFEIEGLTDQPKVIKMPRYAKSIEAEIRRANLADQVGKYLSKYSYMTLASGLNSMLAEMGGGSHAGRGFAEFAYINNTEDNSLISSLCEPSGGKGLRVSVRTLENDLKELVKDGSMESHKETVVLDGKRYSPVVYGSLDAFKADIEQARAVLAEQDSLRNFAGAKPTRTGPEAEPLPFDQAVADKLERYRISRDQWRKDTVGGELAVVMFSELIDQVDDKAREAVLKIPAPEIFSANLALRQVLANRPSGLEMLGRWSA